MDALKPIHERDRLMSLIVEATYENGVLKPAQPLPLAEHEKVQIVVQPTTKPAPVTQEEAERIVKRSSGLIGWTGDVETLRQIAIDPEFDPQESA